MEETQSEMQSQKKEETSGRNEKDDLGNKENKDKLDQKKEMTPRKFKSESESESEKKEDESRNDKENTSKKKGRNKGKKKSEKKVQKEDNKKEVFKKAKEENKVEIQSVPSNKKDDKKYSKKMNKLGGDAFEKMISYKIVHKFFLEDIKRGTDAKKIETKFNSEQYLDIKLIKKEILDKLSPSNNSDLNSNNLKIDYTSQFNRNIADFYNCQNIYNDIYVKSENISSSGISSESSKGYKSDYKGNVSHNSNPDPENNTNSNQENDDTNSRRRKKNKNINAKDITELEFDLFLKDIEGKKLLNFLNEMENKKRLIKFNVKEKINEDEQYNICIEITVQSDDILTKKIPQLYKSVSCFNFLYKTNIFFRKIMEKNKDLINESYAYFIEQTKFLNYDKKLVLITISNGDFDSFKKNETLINEKRKELNCNNPIKSLDSINTSFYIFMVYYPKYDDEIIEQLNERIEKQNLEFLEYKQRQEDEIKELRRIIDELKNQKKGEKRKDKTQEEGEEEKKEKKEKKEK